MYVKTKNFLIEKGCSDPYSTGHLGWWWGIQIISSLIAIIGGRAMDQFAGSRELSIERAIIGMLIIALDILCAINTVKVIKDYSDIEHLLEDSITEMSDNILKENDQ